MNRSLGALWPEPVLSGQLGDWEEPVFPVYIGAVGEPHLQFLIGLKNKTEAGAGHNAFRHELR
jgi:hypothetical protein